MIKITKGNLILANIVLATGAVYAVGVLLKAKKDRSKKSVVVDMDKLIELNKEI